jgi:hypothetical protein
MSSTVTKRRATSFFMGYLLFFFKANPAFDSVGGSGRSLLPVLREQVGQSPGMGPPVRSVCMVPGRLQPHQLSVSGANLFLYRIARGRPKCQSITQSSKIVKAQGILRPNMGVGDLRCDGIAFADIVKMG